jgi:hypothetical protein
VRGLDSRIFPSGSAIRRGVRWLVAVVLVMSLLGLGVAQGKKKKKRSLPPPPADLPGHVNYLARQLYGVPLDESEPLTSQIQKLVIDHLNDWMGKAPLTTAPGDYPLDVRVRRQLEDVFSKLHYPLFGQPAVFTEPWNGALLIGAGYTLGWTDYDRVNVVALYEGREGATRLAALKNFVPRTDLHYAFLPAGPDAFRFFIYGWRLGKSQPRLTAVLYSYDGKTLKSLWETQDIYDGKMEVGKDRVVVRYLKEDEYVRETVRGRKPPRHEATYRVTPQGLELQDDHEIPF